MTHKDPVRDLSIQLHRHTGKIVCWILLSLIHKLNALMLKALSKGILMLLDNSPSQ